VILFNGFYKIWLLAMSAMGRQTARIFQEDL
jgi:hypothetical protein